MNNVLIEKTTISTKWSDIFDLRVDKVPQDIRTFMAEKCESYNNNGFGYKDKDYSNLTRCTQIDTNAVSDEETFLQLINNNKAFVESVNNTIKEWAATGQIYVSPKTGLPFIIDGTYEFNKYHGMTDHDLPQHMQYEKGKTYADILRAAKNSRNPQAAWRIEIKTDNQINKPTSMHKADIVLLHVLGTNQIVIFLPTVCNEERTDDTYICVGGGIGGEWKNVRITEDWSIVRW
jgi:hypothetical protein